MAKTYTVPEFRQRLAKHIETLIDRVAGDIQDLTKREMVRNALLKNELLADAHAEPGGHEAAEVGVPEHMEPGEHEKFALTPPAHPDAVDPVGGGSQVPPGQLDSGHCPLCSKLDEPGSCTCLNDLALGKTELGKNIGGPQAPAAAGLAQSELCKACNKAHGSEACKMEKGSIQPSREADPSDSPPEEKPAHLCHTHQWESDEPCPKCKSAKKSEANPGANKEPTKQQPTPPVSGAKLAPEGGGKKVESVDGKKPKPNGPLNKAGVPEAKPPSGKIPGATATPPMASNTSKPGLTKGALNPQMQQHAMVDASKQAAKPAPAMAAPAAKLTNPNDMSRANAFGAAATGAFAPKGPVNSGLELAGPKKPAGLTAPPPAMREKPAGGPPMAAAKPAGPVLNAAKPQKPGLLGGLFGKSEKCPFCKQTEHPGDCTSK